MLAPLAPIFAADLLALYTAAPPPCTPAAVSFGEVLKKMGENTLVALQEGERAARQAALGLEDPQKATFAVLNATYALKQSTTSLKAGLSAAKDILNMAV